MTNPSELLPSESAHSGIRLEKVSVVCAEFCWFVDEAVGFDYRWGGREAWDRESWTQHLSRTSVSIWVACLTGCPVGFFELEKMPDGSIRIVRFGLLPQFIGQGIGGWLLTEAVQQAWKAGANRIWLTTCSHDHPAALQNYRARGFQVCEERTGATNRRRICAFFGGNDSSECD